MKNLLILLLLSILAFGCTETNEEATDDAQIIEFDETNYIKPSWDITNPEKNEFYVKQQIKNSMNFRSNELETVGKKEFKGETSELELSDHAKWSGEFYLKYKVTKSSYTPEISSPFYKYYDMNGVESTLTIIKGTLDPDLENDYKEYDDMKPAIYLVIRENRAKLTAVVYFYTKGDERKFEAYDMTDTAEAANLLSSSNLFVIPNYMPSFPLKKADREFKLEDGTTMKTAVKDGEMDVTYRNALDSSKISQKWDNDAVWAKETITGSMKSYLMTKDERKHLKATKKRKSPLKTPEDDFEAKLRKVVNLKDSVRLSKEEMSGDAVDVMVDEKYRPWNGSYWSLDTADLAYGYKFDIDTYANYENPIEGETEKVRVDSTNYCDGSIFQTGVVDGKIVMIDSDDEDNESFCQMTYRLAAQGDYLYNKIKEEKDQDKLAKYKAKRKELSQEMVNKMVNYFTIFKEDMNKDNTGLIKIEGKNIVSYDSEGTQIWSFDLNKQSPMFKYAVWHHYTQDDWKIKNPFYIVAWEILNSYHPIVGTGWWGHCNGWSAAGILVGDPASLEDGGVEVELTDGQKIFFDVGDLKGLLTESHYSGASHFYGSRYNDKEDDITDLTPAAFHKLVKTYLESKGVPFVFDTFAGEQVWNFPVYGYSLIMEETTENLEVATDKININKAGVKELDTLWGIGKSSAKNIIAYREHNGPFQKIEDITNVKYITERKFEHFKDEISVGFEKPTQRTFDVVFDLYMASDGQVPDYSGTLDAKNLTKTYTYTLITDMAGNIMDGTWDDVKSHPDFAWVPYNNIDSSRGSENTFLKWSTLKKLVPEELLRMK